MRTDRVPVLKKIGIRIVHEDEAAALRDLLTNPDPPVSDVAQVQTLISRELFESASVHPRQQWFSIVSRWRRVEGHWDHLSREIYAVNRRRKRAVFLGLLPLHGG